MEAWDAWEASEASAARTRRANATTRANADVAASKAPMTAVASVDDAVDARDGALDSDVRRVSPREGDAHLLGAPGSRRTSAVNEKSFAGLPAMSVTPLTSTRYRPDKRFPPTSFGKDATHPTRPLVFGHAKVYLVNSSGAVSYTHLTLPTILLV